MAKVRSDAVDDVVNLLPEWGHSIAQLNALIAEQMGVVVRDLDALHALNRLGPSTASELGARVGLTSGSATRMIDRLEVAGCVHRIRDSEDRRRVVVEPTVEGLERISAYYTNLTSSTREDLNGFTHAELKTISRFLERSSVSTAAELTRLRAHE